MKGRSRRGRTDTMLDATPNRSGRRRAQNPVAQSELAQGRLNLSLYVVETCLVGLR